MNKLFSLWLFVRWRKYLTLVLFVVFVVFLSGNSIVRRLVCCREESCLCEEIDKYRIEYRENTCFV